MLVSAVSGQRSAVSVHGIIAPFSGLIHYNIKSTSIVSIYCAYAFCV